MADSNSQAPRCQCGFWGTPQNGGLCSKCFKEKEKKIVGTATISGATSLSMPLEQAMSSSSIQDLDLGSACARPEPSEETTPKLADPSESTIVESSIDKSKNGEDVCEAQEGSSSDSNGVKRDISEVQDPTESELPVQKNKKRCFKCHCKLELALREIGKCKCNYVFCQLHRLPEQHDCVFDHKEKGRKEAREKMVSPKKHAGTSIKRMDSASS